MLMATAATCLIVAAALFIFQPRRFQLDGTLQLIVGWTFQGVSYLIFGLRGVTWDFLSIVVANTLLPVGYSFLFAAVQQFQDRSYSRAILFFHLLSRSFFFGTFLYIQTTCPTGSSLYRSSPLFRSALLFGHYFVTLPAAECAPVG